ncbi:MAG: hypothetical protein LUD47_04125 [Clostridia bacterium]|nr:hypothetical protein [Clostridia bacterium]
MIMVIGYRNGRRTESEVKNQQELNAKVKELAENGISQIFVKDDGGEKIKIIKVRL